MTTNEKLQRYADGLKIDREMAWGHYTEKCRGRDSYGTAVEYANYEERRMAYEKFCKIFGIKEEK